MRIAVGLKRAPVRRLPCADAPAYAAVHAAMCLTRTLLGNRCWFLPEWGSLAKAEVLQSFNKMLM